MGLESLIKKSLIAAGFVLVSNLSYSYMNISKEADIDEPIFYDFSEVKFSRENPFLLYTGMQFATDSKLLTDFVPPRILSCIIKHKNDTLEYRIIPSEKGCRYIFRIDNSEDYYEKPNLNDIDESSMFHILYIVPTDAAGNVGREQEFFFLDQKYDLKNLVNKTP